jgi:CRP/FNR family transcriptional regulator, cyclic AMP receptor protein
MFNMDKKRLNAFWDNIFEQKEDPSREPLLYALSQVPVFSDLNRRELKRLMPIIHQRYYTEGERVFQIGHPGAAMFVIQSGRINISIPSRDDDLILATLESGAFMGELALLDDSPRSATAIAVEDTITLALFRSDLDKLIETEVVIGSKILKALAKIIGQRLRVTNSQLFEQKEQARKGL